MRGRVLIVDDDLQMGEMLQKRLAKAGFEVLTSSSGASAIAVLERDDVEVVVTDLNMRDMDGLQLCERIVANRPDVPVLVLTAFGSFESAVAAIRVGAYDFITKPVEVETLALALDRAVQHRALREEVKRLRKAAGGATVFEEMLGDSAPMQEVYRLLSRIAETDASVLVTGESGTGKEVVARALHRRSPRRDRPFVALNCAAMPEALLESELFGHARGAFTDARTARTGLLVQADGGTVFLDEIGELPLGMQPKILRALQERTVRPVGSTEERKIDVRIIAATNRDLEQAVEERRFRDDLYFRINVIHLELPPLRARGNDVLLLAQHFVERFSRRLGRPVTGISPEAAERLVSYAWPGNVRELQNCMERAIALTSFETIAVDDLPERIRNYRSSHIVLAGDDLSELVSMEEVERRYVLRVLEAAAGNKLVAARVLGFDRRTLYRKLERWGIHVAEGRVD
ncbi:MAG: sigma-54-dependent Fis family transcriptional regulator [Myxococcales bacterium]|nr:sigma-54-dependent Fis family transcriptional regulator [Myxococcales bacterium]